MDQSDHRAPAGRRPLRIALIVLLVAAAIVGIALAGGGGEPGPAATASPTPGAPVGLTATPTMTPFTVTLTWSAPTGAVRILGYRIFRDQLVIGAVPAGTTTYTDHNVFPGKVFTYEVVTRGDGVLESERTSAQVSIPVPPLSAARVEGDFNVKATTVSQHGFQDTLGRFTLGWNFSPMCDQGACSVVWKDLTEKTLRAALKRDDANYSGSDTGKFLGRCGSVLTNGTVTIALRVVKADDIDSEWRATKVVGTLKNTIGSQLGCVSAGATLSITATLLS